MESEIKLKLQRVVYVSHSVYWYGILLGGTGGLAWPGLRSAAATGLKCFHFGDRNAVA
jgi:hypothetical protein